MQKFFITLLISIMGCMAAMAGDEFSISEGSLAPLKEGGIGSVTINMKETTFDKKMPLRQDERFADVDKNIPEYVSEFVREFNEHAKKFQLTKENTDSQYRFVIDVRNLDVYINLFSFKGGVGTKIWGTLSIMRGDESVAVITLDAWESSGINYNVSLEETFETLAKYLAKRINKGK